MPVLLSLTIAAPGLLEGFRATEFCHGSSFYDGALLVPGTLLSTSLLTEIPAPFTLIFTNREAEVQKCRMTQGQAKSQFMAELKL